MSDKVFYSWQSDLPNSTNRGFIQEALEKAAKAIRNDDSIEVEPVIDRDTQGIGGSPDIASTIFDKIEQAKVFVCDVSFITPAASEGRLTPNPNVLLELGYALKVIGAHRIIMVMNTAYGKIEDLPFDLRLKRVLPYSMKAENRDRAPERGNLSRMLESGLRTIFDSLKKEMPGEVIQPSSSTSSFLEVEKQRQTLRNQLRVEVDQNLLFLREYKERLFKKIPTSGNMPPTPLYNFADLQIPTWSRTLWQTYIGQAAEVLSGSEFQKVLSMYSQLDKISGIRASYQECKLEEKEIPAKKSDLIRRNMANSSMWNSLAEHERNVTHRRNLVWMEMIEVFEKTLGTGNPII